MHIALCMAMGSKLCSCRERCFAHAAQLSSMVLYGSTGLLEVLDALLVALPAGAVQLSIWLRASMSCAGRFPQETGFNMHGTKGCWSFWC